MMPDLPHLTPEQKEYLDQQEESRMHRRTAMEAYGEQMAKLFAQVGGEERDPAKEEMIKQAFADLMCPRPNMPPPGLFPAAQLFRPPQMPTRLPIFQHEVGETVTVYDWRSFVQQSAYFTWDAREHTVVFCTLDGEWADLEGEPAIEFWQWYSEALAIQKQTLPHNEVDAEFKEPNV
jgi:hypothetical protein